MEKLKRVILLCFSIFMFSSTLEASEITTEIIEQARESVVLLQVSTVDNPGITTPTATCAGAVVTKEGYIVTNYHCVHDQKSIKLYYFDDNDWGDYSVEVIGTDPLGDLALLKVLNRKGKDVPFLKFAPQNDIKLGEEVFALGHPMGMVFSLSKGIISSVERYARHPYIKALQTDAAINKGNSGGPLMNTKGEIVGIASLLVSRGGGSQGVGIAIRSDIVRNSVAQMITTGKADRPALGIMIIPLWGKKSQLDKISKDFPTITVTIPNTYGLLMNDEKYVDKTIPKGLRPWDTIIGIDNTFINNGVEFSDKLINYHIGDRVDVSIIRDKRFLRIKDVLVKVLHIDADKMYGTGVKIPPLKPEIKKP